MSIPRENQRKTWPCVLQTPKDSIYVLSAQVLSPFVALDDNLSITAAEYQWLSDSI